MLTEPGVLIPARHCFMGARMASVLQSCIMQIFREATISAQTCLLNCHVRPGFVLDWNRLVWWYPEQGSCRTNLASQSGIRGTWAIMGSGEPDAGGDCAKVGSAALSPLTRSWLESPAEKCTLHRSWLKLKQTLIYQTSAAVIIIISITWHMC